MKKFLFCFLFLSCFSLRAENQINYNPLMTQYIVKKKVLTEDFLLLDVGASGGIHSMWKAFGHHLHAIGFDPLVKECERLNKKNKNKHVNYVACFITSGIKEVDEYESKGVDHPMTRTSAMKMMEHLNYNYRKEVFNAGQKLAYSDVRISLDDYCSQNEVEKADFIKIDTDGPDFKVLLGAQNFLEDEGTLGLFVECDFDDSLEPYARVFRNVDDLLVREGFTLYDLSTWRYTKKELPGKFMYDIPAQTDSGQLLWGDALYLRDFVKMKKQGKTVPVMKLIKMACLQEILGLPDCAAELLIAFRKELASFIDVDFCLDLLTQNMKLHKSYQAHISQFEKDPKSFYPKK